MSTITFRRRPGIWAVGDIAEYESVVHGGRRIRVEHWDVALNHGDYLGKLWAGATDGPYDVVPYFFSDIGDWTWMEYVGPGSRRRSRSAARWTTTTSSPGTPTRKGA